MLVWQNHNRLRFSIQQTASVNQLQIVLPASNTNIVNALNHQQINERNSYNQCSWKRQYVLIIQGFV